MIGLESINITVDIHESKVPLNMQPDYVEIYHNGNILHNGNIIFCSKTGVIKVDVGPTRDKFDEIFNSARRYMPFTFKFLATLKQMKVSYGVEGL